MAQNDLLNLASYKFVAIADPIKMKAQLLGLLESTPVKGTILVAKEGVNINIAAPALAARAFADAFRKIDEFKDVVFKESQAPIDSFTRMLVKIKKEIVAFGVDTIDPENHPAPFITPKELKALYDNNSPFILLDTRNDYEVRVGQFKNTLHLNLKTFRAFPEAVKSLLPQHKSTPIVTVCTGGIRCEKAAPYMIDLGFENVRQLQGGFLDYFKECGNSHYEGDCFIFDKRVALTPELKKSHYEQCFNCRSPLEPHEMTHPSYIMGESCPYCAE